MRTCGLLANYQGGLIHRGCRAADLAESTRKVKLNIQVKVLLGPNENFIQIFSLIFLKISGRAAAPNYWKGKEFCSVPSQLMAG